jgi:hypothetical protein
MPRLMLALSLLLTLSTATAAADEPSPRLIVHEWGTFTSIAGDDGVALDWRPLSGPSDLPSFVYDIANHSQRGFRAALIPDKGSITGSVRMETPVLYFYTDRPMNVSAAVSFPHGHITEWYPAIQSARPGFGHIDWGTFRLLPGHDAPLLTEPAPSHYYPARDTDAVPLRVCTQRGDEHEKFLFYRGVGSFPQPLRVSLQNETVTLQSEPGAQVGAVILFDRRGGRLSFSAHDLTGDAITAPRPTAPTTQADLEAALQQLLIQSGLYTKEADAMIATWRDHWFEDGLRAFYLLPTEATERLLPLTLTPAPAELVRTLVGRIDLITPEQRAQIRAAILRAAALRGKRQQVALQRLRAAHGRFLPVIAQQLLPELPPLPPAFLDALTNP